MTRTPLQLINVPGPPGDAGIAYGRHVADLLAPARREAYIADIARIKVVDRADLARQAQTWLARLPVAYQNEIDGMAIGARVSTLAVAEFLFADIASPTTALSSTPTATPTATHPPTNPATHTHAPAPAAPELQLGAIDQPADGPMCSGGVIRIGPDAWVMRNCDWYHATLQRGTAAVVHHTPRRHAVMALGLLGDIDADTAVNSARLWLHIHTLPALDTPAPAKSCISWLFWARSALEECATLDELEAFIAQTQRDRGVIVVALDGKTGESAVFECTRTASLRLAEDRGRLIATNHRRSQHPPTPRNGSRPGSTISRYHGMCRLLDAAPPEHGPDDLIDILADPDVEMRTPPHLRTIYSAVCCPQARRAWFSAGDYPADIPAASAGTWRPVPWPFNTHGAGM